MRKRKPTQHINWRALKPIVTKDDNPVQCNRVLKKFEAGCKEQWESTGKYVARGDPMMALNWVSTCVVRRVIPRGERVMAERMKISEDSKAFAAERAEKIARGVTPHQEKMLHRKMSRLRRRDHRRWHADAIRELGNAVKQHRWGAAKAWGRMLRGESRKAKILPSLRYRGGGTISSDHDAAEQFLQYMKDLYARLLSDMARFGAD